jgi:hypothetical protein
MTYITSHAIERLDQRLGQDAADDVIYQLEQMRGEPGHVAYVFEAQRFMVADDGSNGNTIVAIAVDGSIETVYFRRSDQDMSPEFFGGRKVIRL